MFVSFLYFFVWNSSLIFPFLPLNSIKFLVMLCFVPYVSTFSYSSLQSKIFLLKQFSLLVISAMSATAAVISPGCQNSSLLVAPGTLVSNCLFHEVKPHFCHWSGLPLKKNFLKVFFNYLAIMLKSRTISNIAKYYILLSHGVHQASVVSHLKRTSVAHSVL